MQALLGIGVFMKPFSENITLLPEIEAASDVLFPRVTDFEGYPEWLDSVQTEDERELEIKEMAKDVETVSKDELEVKDE